MYYFYILFLIFCPSIVAMEKQECSEIRSAIYDSYAIKQPFSEYALERGEQALKLLFPGGRTLFDPNDERGDQQKHVGFYTIDIDYDRTINPHLCGSIFKKEVWQEIPNSTLDLVHIEIPGALFLFGLPDQTDGRQEKDEFILKVVNEKIKLGGKLFIDLRYSRFWPKPTLDIPETFEEFKFKSDALKSEDPDFYVDASYSYNIKHRASFWNALVGDPVNEIEALMIRHSKGEISEKYDELEKRVNEKLDSLKDEERYHFEIPYIIFFDIKTRTHIFQQYDDLLNQYGFKRVEIIELTRIEEKIEAGYSFKHPLKLVDNFIVYDGMCFMDTIAEYERVW
jgi:hypothetical protein